PPPPPFTQTPDYKGADVLIHYADLKVKLVSSGKEVLVERGKYLPQEEFNVTEIEFQVSFPQVIAEKDFVRIVTEMKSLVSIKADVWMFQITDEQLQTLVKAPFAKSLYRLEMGFELTSVAIEALKSLPNLSTLACIAAEMDDKLLERLPELKVN